MKLRLINKLNLNELDKIIEKLDNLKSINMSSIYILMSNKTLNELKSMPEYGGYLSIDDCFGYNDYYLYKNIKIATCNYLNYGEVDIVTSFGIDNL